MMRSVRIAQTPQYDHLPLQQPSVDHRRSHSPAASSSPQTLDTGQRHPAPPAVTLHSPVFSAWDQASLARLATLESRRPLGSLPPNIPSLDLDACCELARIIHDPSTADRVKSGARQMLLLSIEKTIRRLIEKKCYGRWRGFQDDFLQGARQAVFDSIERYNPNDSSFPEHRVAFSVFAWHQIRAGIKECARSASNVPGWITDRARTVERARGRLTAKNGYSPAADDLPVGARTLASLEKARLAESPLSLQGSPQGSEIVLIDTLASSEAAPDQIAACREQLVLLQEAVSQRLTANQQEVFFLLCEGLTAEEIAKSLGKTRAVAKTVGRVRAILMECLSERRKNFPSSGGAKARKLSR